MDLPIEQSVSELTFYMYQRALHPELFQIKASRHFLQGDYEVTIWITGCSHVVSVFSHSGCMTELICPPDQLLPRRGLVERFAFRGERSYQCLWAESFSYLMSFQVDTMSPNVFRQTHKDLTALAKNRGMYVPFSQWNRGELPPFSYVDYEARVDEFHLHVFHAFPEQSTILKTQSLFCMKPS